jgi:hypothetical protein
MGLEPIGRLHAHEFSKLAHSPILPTSRFTKVQMPNILVAHTQVLARTSQRGRHHGLS